MVQPDRPASCLSCRLVGSTSLLLLAGVVAGGRGGAVSHRHRLALDLLTGGLASLALLRAVDWSPRSKQ